MLCQVVNYLPGKKDIWLPRSGHVVSLEVNSLAVPVSMVLDSAGRGYFPPRAGAGAKKQYRSVLSRMVKLDRIPDTKYNQFLGICRILNTKYIQFMKNDLKANTKYCYLDLFGPNYLNI